MFLIQSRNPKGQSNIFNLESSTEGHTNVFNLESSPEGQINVFNLESSPEGQTSIFDSESSPEDQTNISSRHYKYLLHEYFFKLDSSLELYMFQCINSVCNHSKENQVEVTIGIVGSRNSIKKRTGNAMTKDTMSIRNQLATKCY